jgi:2-haloacid dehalogenase
MAYRYLLFDCDRTLLDFNKAMVAALKTMLTKYGFTVTDEVISFYNSLNESLWRQYEEGKITKEQLVHTRFPVMCSRYGIPYPGKEKMETDYFVYLGQGHDIIPGADEVLKSLHEKYGILVITNGFVEVQKNRMTESGLMPYVDYVFISEAVGVSKPDPKFMDAVIEHLGVEDKSNYLIIGDSMNADIALGINAGVDTVLVSETEPQGYDFAPTYRISSLSELEKILEG